MQQLRKCPFCSALWPACLIICQESPDSETWILRRKGEADMGLGPDFASARRSLYALIDYHNASDKNQNAVALGRLGGSTPSDSRAAAARENGKLGGRPRKSGGHGET